MITDLLVLAAISFLIAALATPLVRDAFLRLKILDRPDGQRKLHQMAVPRVGGIPLAAAYVTSLLLLDAIHGPDTRWLDDGPMLAGLVLGSAAIFFTGILDDLFGLKPWQKLAGQLMAAGILCVAGVRISSLGGHGLAPWIGIPLTLAWIAVCTNAFNLIDGLDGLAAGMGLVATLTMFAAALIMGNGALARATLPLAAGLAGFLVYNFNPASVFLGDSGSLLVGFLLGSYAIIWSQKSATLIGMAAPLMALAIPLLDVGLSIARRWLRGHSILRGDRSHIHHKLLERGLTHRGVVLMLYAMAALSAAFALVQSFAPVGVAVFTAVAFCAALWVGVDKLGYLEFHGARRALSTTALRRSIRGEITLEGVERRIGEAMSVEACWEAVRDASRQLGFSRIEAHLGGRMFRDDGEQAAQGACWELRVPLGDGGGYVQVGRSLSGPEPAELAPFVDMLRSRLMPRLVMVGGLRFASKEPDPKQLAHLAEHLTVESAPVGERASR